MPSRLPAGFTELEYIESSGTQYIDVGFKWSYNISNKSVCRMMSRKSSGIGIVAARNSSARAWGNFQTNESSNNNYACFGSNVNVRFTWNAADGNYHEWYIDNAGFYIDGTLKADVSGSASSLVSNENITFFGRYNGNGSGTIERTGSWRLKSSKFWNSGTLIMDLVPARRDSDSEIGLYDIVSDAFFTNAGTGTFSYGELQSL